MTSHRIIDDLSISDDKLSELINSLPDWRRNAALRFRHKHGRRECCLSYLVLCDMLRDNFGITHPPRFIIGEHGKPTLAYDDGTLIDGVSFNISHCRRAIICVVSDNEEVGVDVECTGRYSLPLAKYSMNEEEQRHIAAAEDPDAEFTMLWTKKEALLKLTGEGITDELRTVLHSERINGVMIETHCDKTKGYAWSVARKNRLH